MRRRFVLKAIEQIYAKAFDQDERLLAVGFLDVGVHTTCIRTLKNLILVGDAVKGLSFIAFQVSSIALRPATPAKNWKFLMCACRRNRTNLSPWAVKSWIHRS